MTKKTMAILLSAILLAGTMTGCGSADTGESGSNTGNSAVSVKEGTDDHAASSVITVGSAYGDVEIPYAPSRICVLDMNTMDIIHTFDLGDKVASLVYNKKHTMYLADYYASESIVSLTLSGRNTEEGADPYEAYYSIDADLIIGDTGTVDADAYAVLSQIAPTVILTNAEESGTGKYEAVMANAKTVASIWGLDDKMAEISAEYDAKYAKLETVCAGKTYLVAGGDADNDTFRLATSEDGGRAKTAESSDRGESSGNSEKSGSGSGGSNKQANTTDIIAFLTELGMVNITDTTPEEVRATALAELDGDAAAKKMTDWIESAAPDGLFLTQRDYETYEDVLNAGHQYLYLDTLTVYKNGGFAILGTEWTQLSCGLTAMMTMVDQLAAAFLD